MTLRHLKIFVAVVNNNSITKASEELYLAQPAVSLAIKELEEYYHTKLFSRIGKKLYITDAGTRLYEYALRILELVKIASDDLENHNYTKQIKIGASVSIAKVILTDLIKYLKDKFKNSKINVVVRNANCVLDLLAKNEIDIALVLTEDYNLENKFISKTFLKDNFVFICSQESPLSNQEISLSELADYDLIVREDGSAQKDIITSLSKLSNKHFNMPYSIASNDVIIDYVKNNFGVSLISSYFLTNEVSTFVVKNIKLERDLRYVIHKSKYQNDLLVETIKYLDSLANLK